MSTPKEPSEKKARKRAVSRRGFIQGVGAGTGAVGVGLLERPLDAQTPGKVSGPGEVPISLSINGKTLTASAEPRETLLDVMRNRLDLTAAKRVCDRGTCGACTVIVNGKATYSCTVLAIDAQGRQIQTLEGIAQTNNPHPIVAAFVEHDAQQCGYCTPGFVVASKALLDKSPNPTPAQIKEGLGGNFCRCGTYVGIRQAVAEAGKKLNGGRTNG